MSERLARLNSLVKWEIKVRFLSTLLEINNMIVTVKSKDNYKVDITSLYIKALEKSISVEDYKKELDFITSNNKNN